MKIDFTDQVVLVTGASRGIGLQIADDFLACGATLIATSTNLENKEGLLERFGSQSKFFAVDFSSSQSTEAFLEKLKKIERIDVCVNNAGLSRHTSLAEASETDWDVTNDVNLKAPFLLTRDVSEIMRRNNYGKIVNISSIWGHVTMPERSVYAATKFGLRGLTVSAAADLAKFNILVNTVSPGFTLTDMVKGNYSQSKLNEITDKVPLGRLAEPADISKAVLFLSSKLNSYITGQSLIVDGGYSII